MAGSIEDDEDENVEAEKPIFLAVTDPGDTCDAITGKNKASPSHEGSVFNKRSKSKTSVCKMSHSMATAKKRSRVVVTRYYNSDEDDNGYDNGKNHPHHFSAADSRSEVTSSTGTASFKKHQRVINTVEPTPLDSVASKLKRSFSVASLGKPDNKSSSRRDGASPRTEDRSGGGNSNGDGGNETRPRKPNAEHDPENHEIKRLREKEGLKWAEIAHVLNKQRVERGKLPPTLTGNAIYGRYTRNAPRIAAALGEDEWKSKRLGGKATGTRHPHPDHHRHHTNNNNNNNKTSNSNSNSKNKEEKKEKKKKMEKEEEISSSSSSDNTKWHGSLKKSRPEQDPSIAGASISGR